MSNRLNVFKESRLKRLKRRNAIENVIFVIFVAVVIVGVIYFLGALFAAPGYVMLLVFGKEFAFWPAAALGFGTIFLIIVAGFSVGGIIRSLRG